MHFVGELCRRLAKVNGKYKNRKYSARSSAQCSARWWAKLRGAQQKFGQEIRPRDSAKIFDQQNFGQEKLDQTLPPRNAAKKFGQRNSTHNNQPNNSAKKIGQTFSLGPGVLVPGPTVPGPLVLGPWDPGPLGPGPEPANTLQNDLKSAQIIPIIFAYSVQSRSLTGGGDGALASFTVFGSRTLLVKSEGRGCISLPQKPGSFYVGNLCALEHNVEPCAESAGCYGEGPPSKQVQIAVMLRSDVFRGARTRKINAMPGPAELFIVVIKY